VSSWLLIVCHRWRQTTQRSMTKRNRKRMEIYDYFCYTVNPLHHCYKSSDPFFPLYYFSLFPLTLSPPSLSVSLSIYFILFICFRRFMTERTLMLAVGQHSIRWKRWISRANNYVDQCWQNMLVLDLTFKTQFTCGRTHMFSSGSG